MYNSSNQVTWKGFTAVTILSAVDLKVHNTPTRNTRVMRISVVCPNAPHSWYVGPRYFTNQTPYHLKSNFHSKHQGWQGKYLGIWLIKIIYPTRPHGQFATISSLSINTAFVKVVKCTKYVLSSFGTAIRPSQTRKLNCQHADAIFLTTVSAVGALDFQLAPAII